MTYELIHDLIGALAMIGLALAIVAAFAASVAVLAQALAAKRTRPIAVADIIATGGGGLVLRRLRRWLGF